MTRKLPLMLLIVATSMSSTCSIAAEKTVRVVVTGIDESGKSVIVSDGAPQLMLRAGPGSFMGDLWKTDTTPKTNQDGYLPKTYSLEPEGAGGVSFRVASIPPVQQPAQGTGTEFGMHQTDTIDFITIISGELYARLDGGEEVLLKPGDTLVQRGTRHAWINRGNVPCVFSAVMVKPMIAAVNSVPAH